MKGWGGFLFLGLLMVFVGFNCWKFGCRAYGKFPVPRFVNVLMVVYGFVIVVVSLKVIMSKKSKKDRYLICPKCQSVVETFQSPDGKCSKCGVDLESLAGFYERHPEFKPAPKKERMID